MIPAAMAEPPAGNKWKLVWGDEFNGTSLDQSKWTIREDDGGSSWRVKEGVRLDGKGNLLLRAWMEKNRKCFSGGIYSYQKFQHRYGYYELRCILPQEIGHWASYWLQSTKQGMAPYDPRIVGDEVDIFEYFEAGTDVISQNIHWGCHSDYYEHMGHEAEVPGLKERKYHTYGLLWTPTKYIFYIDGERVWQTSRGVSNHELYVILSDDMEAGNYKGMVADDYIFKEDFFVVDYFRVYDMEDELAPPAEKKGNFVQLVELFTDEKNADLLRSGIPENLSRVIHSPETHLRQFPLIEFKPDGGLDDLKVRDNKFVESASPDTIPCETLDTIYGSLEYLKGNNCDICPVLSLRADMNRRVGWKTDASGKKTPIMRYKRGHASRQLLNPNTWYVLSDTLDTVEMNGKPEKKSSLVLYRLFTSGEPLKKAAASQPIPSMLNLPAAEKK
jgi:hypothetical protein